MPRRSFKFKLDSARSTIIQRPRTALLVRPGQDRVFLRRPFFQSYDEYHHGEYDSFVMLCNYFRCSTTYGLTATLYLYRTPAAMSFSRGIMWMFFSAGLSSFIGFSLSLTFLDAATLKYLHASSLLLLGVYSIPSSLDARINATLSSCPSMSPTGPCLYPFFSPDIPPLRYVQRDELSTAIFKV